MKLVNAIFQLLAYKTLRSKLILAFDGFYFFVMNVRWIFSQEYFLPHNKVINNVGNFYCPSTQIEKDDIAEMPAHVLALGNDPSKGNFGLVVIKPLFKGSAGRQYA